MPYKTKEDLPEAIQSLSEHAREIWMAAYNSAWKQYDGDEAKSAATAWAAVKTKYEKKEGDWVKKKDFGEGLRGWIEIFRGGKQIDSRGREHDADSLIDKAVSIFNAAEHEPPVVVGHPKDNAPAFGWVEAVKKEGNRLLAKFRQVVPEFEDAVKQGLYKKRSASFYPDGRLRHVGFLGAAPPAVKGLADIAFQSDDQALDFEFDEYQISNIGRIFQRLREFMIEKFGSEAADKVVGNWEIEELTRPSEMQTIPAFSDIDFKKHAEVKIAEAKKEESVMPYTEEQMQDLLKKQAAEFSEKIEAAKKEAREKASAEFAETGRQARQGALRKEIMAWMGQMIKDGKLTPGIVKYGLPEMLEFMAASEDMIEFGEGKEKTTMYDRLKGLFETQLPKMIEFGEVATRGKDAGAGAAGEKLSQLTQGKMKEIPTLSYGAAFAEVQKENPELALEYTQEITQEVA